MPKVKMIKNQICTIFLVLFISNVAFCDVQHYVNILGENFQYITGASETDTVVDGVFLNKSFSGKRIFVRTQEHYELDGFRQPTNSANNTNSASATTGMAAAGNTQEKKLMTRFGPLTDSGVVIHENGDFHGWYCSNLYVTPLGNRKYELSCEKEMMYR